jgi:hypothetical protein
MPTGEVDIEVVPVLRARVLGEVSEIAVVSPSVLGGHTTAGNASLNLFVETVWLRTVLIEPMNAIATSRVRAR